MISKSNMAEKKVRILVIDDDDVLLKHMECILNDERFEVETAIDGEAGLRKFNENPFNVVFLDLALPDIHGLKILRKIKNSHPETLVIIMSGNLKLASFATNKLNADDYIDKPLNPYIVSLLIELHDLLKARDK